MADRPGVLLRFDVLDALEQLAPADAGELVIAVLRYGRDGTAPDFKNPVLSVVWPFIRGAVDRDGENYDGKVAQRRYAVYVRETKKRGEVPMSFDDWKVSVDIGNERSMVPDIQSQSQSQSQSQNQVQSQKQTQVSADKPPIPARRKYGTYGWVRLADDEYARLEHDLGAVELARCIAYVDESAQGNGNKNRWKDWNLVIRRCSREGWGRNRAQMEDKNRLRTESDYSVGSGDFFGGDN